MGCLTFCRWCCCCFLAAINVLTTIIGIVTFLIGCVSLWGYWVLRQTAWPKLTELIRTGNNGTKLDSESMYQMIESVATTIAIVLLLLGVLIIVTSCLGCCGACFGVPACLIIYSVLIGILILAQAAFVVIWFSNRDIVTLNSRTWLENRVANYRGTNMLQLDLLQAHLKCCGVDNRTDFNKPGVHWNRTVIVQSGTANSYSYANASYPVSCCKTYGSTRKNETCINNVSAQFYDEGCYEKIKSLMRSEIFDNFFYSLAGILGIYVLLIIGALLIYFHKRREQADIPHANVQYKMQPQMA